MKNLFAVVVGGGNRGNLFCFLLLDVNVIVVCSVVKFIVVYEVQVTVPFASGFLTIADENTSEAFGPELMTTGALVDRDVSNLGPKLNNGTFEFVSKPVEVGRVAILKDVYQKA